MKVFNVLKALVPNHECDIVCFGDFDPELDSGLKEALPGIGVIRKVPLPAGGLQFMAVLGTVLQLMPPSFAGFSSRGMQAELRKALRDGKYDVVHYDIINMAQYHDGEEAIASVHSPNDATSQVYFRQARVAAGLLKKLRLYLSALLLRKYERDKYAQFSKVHVVSDDDGSYLNKVVPEAEIEVIPISSGYSYELCRNAHLARAFGDAPIVVVCGNFGDAGISLGLEKFLVDVFPHVREEFQGIRLRLLGPRLSNELLERVRACASIEYVAWVESFEGFITEADVVLVPDLAGAPGAKTRVVQAMALGKAVVGSTTAFEGIPVSNGSQGFVYDSSEQCRTFLVELLQNDARRQALGAAAASLAAEMYSFERVSPKYEALYVAARERHVNPSKETPGRLGDDNSSSAREAPPNVTRSARNSHGLKSLIVLLTGVALALVFLTARYVGRKTDFSDAATLGARTTSIFASRGGFPIHCQSFGVSEGCMRGIAARKPAIQYIWFGNSQLHAINDYRHGERNAPDFLAARLAGRGIDLVTFSMGNASLQEHFAMFQYLRSRIRIRRLILPVVFDDFREDGLRDEVAQILRDDAAARLVSESRFGKLLLEKTFAKAAKSPDAATPQDYVEGRLNEFLDESLPVWKFRPEMRGDVLIGLYRLRNTVFGITPSTQRKMIPGRYAANLMALEALLDSAKAAGIPVLMYVAPVGIRNGERPYVEAEYLRFKKDAQSLAENYGARFENLEALVPEDLWGRKSSTSTSRLAELDFMHFTSAGHAILANRIEGLLSESERDKARSPQ